MFKTSAITNKISKASRSDAIILEINTPINAPTSAEIFLNVLKILLANDPCFGRRVLNAFVTTGYDIPNALRNCRTKSSQINSGVMIK